MTNNNPLISEPSHLDFLYPAMEPYASGMLNVDDLHQIYWETSGNPQGIPALFLHGGPGGGTSPKHRRFFDPKQYRIVLFDQRGAGKSLPYGELKDNTTLHLIGDIEKLRVFLGVKQWLVFGGSWGSTLALAYAEAHPTAVLGLILRGIFLCRPSEIDWFLYGLRSVFPEAWERFADYIPAQERHNLLQAYYQRLINPDPAVHLPAARIWSGYEGSCSTLRPDPDLVHHFESDATALGIARIEAHYFTHQIFLPENALLNSLHKIRHLPCSIVQGRYDMVCPIISAHELHQAWPEAHYEIIDDAGHAAWEPGITKALVGATKTFSELLRQHGK